MQIDGGLMRLLQAKQWKQIVLQSCLYGSIKLRVGLQLLCVDQVFIGLDLTNLLNGKLK